MLIRSLFILLMAALPFMAQAGNAPSCGQTYTYSRLVILPNGTNLVDHPGIYGSTTDASGAELIGAQTHYFLYDTNLDGVCKFLGFTKHISMESTDNLPLQVSFVGATAEGQLIFPRAMVTRVISQIICQ
jgi:hypothetical protein